jgi:hypothetical protein
MLEPLTGQHPKFIKLISIQWTFLVFLSIHNAQKNCLGNHLLPYLHVYAPDSLSPCRSCIDVDVW